MQDLVLALEWVRDNIAAFGGDPGDVTIFGESGGGAKVSALLAMPSAKGLFHKAIVMSGAVIRLISKDEATDVARAVMAELGVTDVAQLQGIDARRVFDASEVAITKTPKGDMWHREGLCPVVDGDIIPRDPFDPTAPEISADVPLMVGTVRDEEAVALLANPSLLQDTEAQALQRLRGIVGQRADAGYAVQKALAPSDPPIFWSIAGETAAGRRGVAYVMAERKVRQAGALAHVYIFMWRPPGERAKFHSPHGVDVGVVFGNAHLSAMSGRSEQADAMHKVMAATWTAFARSGQPDNSLIPSWPAYDLTVRPTMLLNIESRLVNDFEAPSRKYWAS
jgi:para-nitrobenzyl esterase